MNSNWNYGYLHNEHGYGFDPVTGISMAVAAVSGAVGAGISAKTSREQAKSDEQLARIQLLQSKQDAATSDSMLKVALAKSTQESAAQTEIAKNVMLGLAAVAVIGGLVYLSKDLLKAPPEA
jgi:hypothetical protein